MSENSVAPYKEIKVHPDFHASKEIVEQMKRVRAHEDCMTDAQVCQAMIDQNGFVPSALLVGHSRLTRKVGKCSPRAGIATKSIWWKREEVEHLQELYSAEANLNEMAIEMQISAVAVDKKIKALVSAGALAPTRIYSLKFGRTGQYYDQCAAEGSRRPPVPTLNAAWFDEEQYRAEIGYPDEQESEEESEDEYDYEDIVMTDDAPPAYQEIVPLDEWRAVAFNDSNGDAEIYVQAEGAVRFCAPDEGIEIKQEVDESEGFRLAEVEQMISLHKDSDISEPEVAVKIEASLPRNVGIPALPSEARVGEDDDVILAGFRQTIKTEETTGSDFLQTSQGPIPVQRACRYAWDATPLPQPAGADWAKVYPRPPLNTRECDRYPMGGVRWGMGLGEKPVDSVFGISRWHHEYLWRVNVIFNMATGETEIQMDDMALAATFKSEIHPLLDWTGGISGHTLTVAGVAMQRITDEEWNSFWTFEHEQE